MFDNLSDRLERSFKILKGEGKITEINVAETLKDIRRALLGDGQKKEYEGRVSWISSRSEFTPKTIVTDDERADLVYAVKISVKNDGYIKIGMYGEVKL